MNPDPIGFEALRQLAPGTTVELGGEQVPIEQVQITVSPYVKAGTVLIMRPSIYCDKWQVIFNHMDARTMPSGSLRLPF